MKIVPSLNGLGVHGCDRGGIFLVLELNHLISLTRTTTV